MCVYIIILCAHRSRAPQFNEYKLIQLVSAPQSASLSAAPARKKNKDEERESEFCTLLPTVYCVYSGSRYFGILANGSYTLY